MHFWRDLWKYWSTRRHSFASWLIVYFCCKLHSNKAGIIRCSHMMTSSNGNIFRVTGPLCGEFTGPGEFPTQRPVTRSFDVFFDLRLNKRLSKQPWGWWFETPSWSLWRQFNELWIHILNSVCATRFATCIRDFLLILIGACLFEIDINDQHGRFNIRTNWDQIDDYVSVYLQSGAFSLFQRVCFQRCL